MRLARFAAVLALLGGTGCAVGAGGTLVGQWRSQRVVESTACIEHQPGVCDRVVAIGSDQRARDFAGGVFTFAEPGYAQVRTAGKVETKFLIDGSYEYLRGHGRFALAGRVGLGLLVGGDRSWLLVPVTLIGHLGASWGSVFAGIGYSPVVRETHDGGSSYFHDGVEALIGTRVLLRTTLGRNITASPELRYQKAGAATIAVLTFNLGLHF